MIPLSSAASGGLTWSKVPHTRNYELKSNDEIIGKLERPTCWSSNMLAQTKVGRWVFRHGGFLGTGAEITDADSNLPIAAFKSSWSGRGTLIFADGQTFHFDRKGWWRPVWTVSTEDGQAVLELHNQEKTVELRASAPARSDRLSLLTMFAWYRALRAEEEDASIAAMTAIVAS